jgi:hypothetical protein
MEKNTFAITLAMQYTNLLSVIPSLGDFLQTKRDIPTDVVNSWLKSVKKSGNILRISLDVVMQVKP